LPVVLSVQEAARLLAAAEGARPGGPKCRTALSVAYGAGLMASEVVRIKVADIDSGRMVVRVEQGKGRKDHYAILPEPLLDLLRLHWYLPGRVGVRPLGGIGRGDRNALLYARSVAVVPDFDCRWVGDSIRVSIVCHLPCRAERRYLGSLHRLCTGPVSGYSAGMEMVREDRVSDSLRSAALRATRTGGVRPAEPERWRADLGDDGGNDPP
jgi:hypothetical protein